jgi:hypothetical protein
MKTSRGALVVAGLLAIAAPGVQGQSAPLNPATAKPFLGVWAIEMTEPSEFKGIHTIRIWDNGGTLAASIQTNPKFPAIEATGIHMDGNMVVLTVSHNAKPRPMQENGAPIWAVVSAVVDGDTMKVALMLERSQTIKRGAGRRQK